MTNQSETASWEEDYKKIKENHDEAYFTLQDACNEDCNENLEVALEKYKKGVAAMNAALNVTIACPSDNSDENYRKAVKMIYRLKDVKPKIVTRLETIEKILEERKLRENNPTTFSLLVKALNEVQTSPGSPDVHRELVFCCEDVKFYNIKQDGMVTLSLDNTLLEIYKYKKATSTNESEEEESDGTFFMQITKTSEPILAPAVQENVDGELSSVEETAKDDTDDQKARTLAEIVWTYPLLPGVSPCFRTRFGAIIFPDLRTAPDSRATIGIQVEGLPDVVLMEVLDEILKCVHRQTPAGEPSRRHRSVSVNVSDKITKGAFFISQGLIKGSQKTGEFITFGTPYLISRLSKAPQDAPPVSSKVRSGVEVAKTVTGTAATVTGFMAQKLGSATMALGRFIAPHLQNQGSRLLSHGLGLSQEDASEKMADALTVAAGAVEAFSTVYTGLEESASILGQSLSNNSVKVIDHKYGASAGNLASTTFETVGNMFTLSQNVKLMTPKGIAKKTAKSAGKALVEDFQPISGPSASTDIVKNATE
ncbi:spartin [Sergentomyia squamirostris]